MKARLLPLIVAIILVVGIACAETVTKTASVTTPGTSAEGLSGVSSTAQTDTGSRVSTESSGGDTDAGSASSAGTSEATDSPSSRSGSSQATSILVAESEKIATGRGSAQSDTSTTSGTNEDSAESKMQEFNMFLDIQDLRKPQTEVVTKLLERKNSDEANFNHIVFVAKRTVTRSTEKELLVDELGDMDKGFVAEFSIRASKPLLKEKVNNQVRDYLKAVNNPETVTIKIDDKKIKEVFIENKAFDTLIAEIWD